MKKKLKQRIKLIKLLIFLFGFLVFIGLFMGLQSTNSRAAQNPEQDNSEKIGTIFPREFTIRDEDYVRSEHTSPNEDINANSLEASEQSTKSLADDGYIDAKTMSLAHTNTPDSELSLQIPEIFNSHTSGDDTYRVRSAGGNGGNVGQNSIDRAIQEITGTRKLLEEMQDANKYVVQGRNSGLFVGKNNAAVGIEKNSLLGNMSSRLDSSLSQLLQSNNTRDSFSIQNAQDKKISYLENQRNTAQHYTLSSKGSFYSDYEDTLIIAGTVIPIAMITGIDSDLPGMISARVTENVYDSLYGTDILIPQGSMLIGSYDSSLSWGQKRLILVWNRLSRPDGYHLELESMQGIDSQGASGVRGRAKTYVGQSLAASALTSMFGLGINVSTYNVRKADVTGSVQEAVDESSSGFKNTVRSLTNKLLNRQPTIKIKPGTKSYVFVNKDMYIPIFRGATR